MKKPIRTFLLSFLFSLPAFAEAALSPPVGEAGPDLSAAYQEVFASRPALSRESFAGEKVVFVPGFIADQIEAVRGYFRDQAAVLAGLGLAKGKDYLVLRNEYGFSGERGVSNNAEAILEVLRASERPVLLVSHSKGSDDVLEALLREPALRAKVKGWISIQGAIAGTVLADSFSAGLARPVVGLYLAAWGGDISSLEDLRQPVRLAYLTQHLEEIRRLVQQVPVLSVSTRLPRSDLPLEYRALAPAFGPDAADHTDGLLELRNTLVPYGPYVELPGVDHRELVQGVDSKVNRTRFTQAIFALFERLTLSRP